MRKPSAFATLVFFVILIIGGFFSFVVLIAAPPLGIGFGILTFIFASLVSSAIKVADQWDRAVVLRLGRFNALRGPGLFFIIPVIDSIPYWIDIRVIPTSFKAEKTLTKDTVPVDVDAVLFWQVFDPKKAALDVADYQSAISWASQTALRDVIGKTMLSDMLEGREKISKELQKIIDERTEPWGIKVISVEVKDVLIPPALEDAMSMQAQAERERQARVILGDSERAGRREIRRGRQDLHRQSRGPAPAGHEHALRGPQAKLDHRDRAQFRRRKHAARRPRGDDCADHGRAGTGEEGKGRHAAAIVAGMILKFCLRLPIIAIGKHIPRQEPWLP